MYVILEVGGKQYKLSQNDTFLINRLQGKPSSTVKFKNIIFAKEKNSYKVGDPYLKDSHVTCQILSHPRGAKVTAFKYKRRKSEKWKVGHRQDLTALVVKEIRI